ncbi:acetyl-CoA synthetase [Bathymodiolus platifrons methanotrophic gill symbiont]|uniref:acetate--CoA ligase n=1 Tax=Bathymodiolus platifrons methanotrophic gill symbiont TaxID=113268 RepID=UPI000B412C2B|nr:acetate--CoA ligase [Bathymodiolus platifrons methanotrophic gill symbiont]GAW85855.1 acetyl-CoA synthetase [Bathymodiolus platifrons methanotrophic gill symbiont]
MALYQQSIDQPEAFWAEQAEQFLDWQQPWDKVMEYDYPKGEISWFAGGKLNVSVNCLDRHLATRGDQVALIWEGDDPANDKKMTYKELHQEVCQFANVLKERGVKKGDRVCIYLPMLIEAAAVILACTRIGAVHSIVFGGFSAEALKDRINDSDCKLVVCADEGYRGGKLIPIKATVDKAIEDCPCVKSVVVIKNSGNSVNWNDECDVWYHELMSRVSIECKPEWMDAEDPLFILYTSGSTGQPKGLLHTTGGYLLYAAMTHKYIFDYQEGEIYWCTADIGWITGHTYMIYGPLCNGATTLLFEGVPTYPDAGRFWQVIDKHQVNIFYTAPTALRALMAIGDEPVYKTDRSSLRILGSVGEPINPEAWEWYYELIGKQNCPIVDTWWQTETGGILITPLPGATELIPSSATRPFFGVKPAILSNEGQVIEDGTEGVLVMERPWPGQARSIYGDHQRFIDTYFKNYPGYYFTGDGARRDERGYYWITGRVDDVINVSGHRMGTAEVESALDEHKLVAESAVVGYPHDIKGQGIYAYVTLHVGIEGTEELKKELIQLVRTGIGPIATPDIIQWSAQLPKTRSGKIMRRILRKIAANEIDSLGDTSTLADPDVVQSIIDNRLNR